MNVAQLKEFLEVSRCKDEDFVYVGVDTISTRTISIATSFEYDPEYGDLVIQFKSMKTDVESEQ